MSATATGRGAQVIVDPGSDTEKAIRGAYAPTLEGNIAKVRDDRLAGVFPYAETSPDGTTITGGRATDFATVPGTGVPRILNPAVASIGNGADTTEDTLQTYVIPANTLRNIGDLLRIRAGGQLGATTDTKIVRIKINGNLMMQCSGATAGGNVYTLETTLQKTAPNVQASTGIGLVPGAAIAGTSNAPTITDTAPMTLTITGQNTTNAVAGSITCRFLTVEYVPA